jgi:glycosyltransferase involved in cell wall biosynthesis
MRVLVAHNAYLQQGGEDHVFDVECRMLERHSHHVVRYTVHNDQLLNVGRFRLARSTLWNGAVYHELRALIRETKPDVAHFHNTLPIISPAAYYAARAEGVPVVQTLHNYRLLCPGSLFFRDGRVCEDCMGKTLPWPGVAHACYRERRAASGAVAAMLGLHRIFGTWAKKVDRYIALTEFARGKFIEGGIPPERLVVKPNFVDPDPGFGSGSGGYAIFVGRLSVEKGVGVMLRAWDQLKEPVPLKIVGEGPLAPEVAQFAKERPHVEWLGWVESKEVLSLMKNARFMVFPSTWYEAFGLVLVEALAVGLPVLTSDLGGMTTIVEEGHTGLHFQPGDSEDLARKVEHAVADPEQLTLMRIQARSEYKIKYTASRNYSMLIAIYEQAIQSAEKRI